MSAEERPTAAQEQEERCRVMLPVINSDHMIFSVKLSVKWSELPPDARAALHEKFVSFANDMQLEADRLVKGSVEALNQALRDFLARR